MTAWRDPVASFVVPAYNAAGSIGRTLASLSAQTERRWEAVVVDDGSTDGTAGVAQSTGDDRVSVLGQANAGPSAARNRGFDATHASLVCFLDADDTLDPRYLERLAPLASSSRIGAACGFRYAGPGGRTLHTVPPPPADALTVDRLLRLDPPAIMSVLHQRSALAAVVLSDGLFETGSHSFEDWDVLRRLGAHFGDAHRGWPVVPECLAAYWCEPGSLSAAIERVLEGGQRAIDRLGVSAERAGASTRAHRVRCLAACLVASDAVLAARLLDQLGTLHEPDAAAIASAMRWHAMRRWALPEDDIGAKREIAIASVRTVLGHTGLADPIERLVSRWGRGGWERAVDRLVEVAGDRGRPVIFGLGRNGVRAVRAAREAGVACWVIDDDPTRDSLGFTRLTIDELDERDAVLVTPDESADAQRRLRLRGVAIVLPDGLAVV